MRRTIVVVLATLCAGCVGVATFYHAPEPVDLQKAGLYGRGHVMESVIKPDRITKQVLKAKWGDPDEVIVQGDTERWRYAGDMHWGTVMPILVLVPIPLFYPEGAREAELTFRGDELVAITSDQEKHGGLVCGMLVNTNFNGTRLGCE